MNRVMSLRELVIAIACLALGGASVAFWFHAANTAPPDLAGVEQLHRLDSLATLSDNADELVKLWDDRAVRIQAGRPAEVGKATIYEDDRRWEASPGRERSVCYDMEIQDLQFAGDWAFEWAYGSYETATSHGKVIQRGKVMRIMRRQRDGSWKFTHVIGLADTIPSAAPVKHPCVTP